ncbi:MAG: hypothetical protein HYZ53_15515 [Planctomycetes bacterium]|nr:hypothetical protein [Planctomycetota bacterium]
MDARPGRGFPRIALISVILGILGLAGLVLEQGVPCGRGARTGPDLDTLDTKNFLSLLLTRYGPPERETCAWRDASSGEATRGEDPGVDRSRSRADGPADGVLFDLGSVEE